MIHQYIKKVKEIYSQNSKDIISALIVFLTGMASFGLGRLSAILPAKEPISITEYESRGLFDDSEKYQAGIALPKQAKEGKADILTATRSLKQKEDKYVASKSGKAYHFPWCPGAQRIKDKNKIWFSSREEAEKAGYRPAANCPGL